jgi:hypothetical protein
MNWIEQIVSAILKWFTSLVQSDKISQDAKPQEDLKQALHDRINDHERGVRID